MAIRKMNAEEKLPMGVERISLGTARDGLRIEEYVLSNRFGLRVRIMTYGATITSVEVPDRNGTLENITLSLDSLEDYVRGHPCLGSTIGRYANRIAQGRFSIDGVEYKLATNNGPNHLHGGLQGFDKVVWGAAPFESQGSVGVAFSYHSPDGEEGYPGNLDAQVVYSLTDQNELKMAYSAATDKKTVVNLTNHAYWNLRGNAAGDVLEHELTIDADYYLPVDAGQIPLGELKAVAGTPMDFTQPRTIGSRLQETHGGYDHCYVLNKRAGAGDSSLTPAATAFEPTTGRMMEVFTTEPGVQLYTANGLHVISGGKTLQKHQGFCLETQHYPDSPNHPHFPSTLLAPGETYHQLTVHRFSVRY